MIPPIGALEVRMAFGRRSGAANFGGHRVTQHRGELRKHAAYGGICKSFVAQTPGESLDGVAQRATVEALDCLEYFRGHSVIFGSSTNLGSTSSPGLSRARLPTSTRSLSLRPPRTSIFFGVSRPSFTARSSTLFSLST